MTAAPEQAQGFHQSSAALLYFLSASVG